MYKIDSTTHFDRQLKKLTARHFDLIIVYENALNILEQDPYNISRTHKIKKLTDIAPATKGMWRFTDGAYRIRYDIEGKKVILLRISDRKDAYQK